MMEPLSTGLGRLQRIDAREVWKHEAAQFTPWLLEHIEQLNEAIGFEIELSGREQRVGPFAVDLYGIEVQTGHPAIIENQLEPSDHSHLGQLLTYAAGLRAGVVVWIAPQFRDEHREALNWLNEISPEDVSFFAVEVEVLDINGQRAANFKPVAQPNSWQKARSTGSSRGGRPAAVSDRMLAYQHFFAELLEQLKSQSPGITTASRTQMQSWFSFSAGRSGLAFALAFGGASRFRVELYIDTGNRERNELTFDALAASREEIERDFGQPLEWQRLDARAKRIAVFYPKPVTMGSSTEDLAELKEWAVATTLRFVNVFRRWTRTLPS